MQATSPSATKVVEHTLFDIAREVGISGTVDIALMAMFVYAALVLFERSRGAAVLRGIMVMGAVYLLAHQFDLLLTQAVLEGFFAVLLVALIVIFRDELRRFFEIVARWSLTRKFDLGRGPTDATREAAQAVVNAVSHFARRRTGALIVLRGRGPLDSHLAGGVPLDGLVSQSLLESIFDPHSLGHDGAVAIHAGRIVRFGCHLPLSKDFDKLKHKGTRHAAALGISEVTDALCIVVSEERGSMSVAWEGELHPVHDMGELTQMLDAFYASISAPLTPSSWRELVRRDYRRRATSVGISIALWFVLVYASKQTQRSFVVPVEYTELAPQLEVQSVVPREVTLKFSGARRSFYFVNRSSLRVVVSLSDAGPGINAIALSDFDVSAPRDLTMKSIEPDRVTVQVGRKQ